MARCFFVTVFGLAMASRAGAGIGDQPPPEAFLDPIDQQIARTGIGVPGRPSPCTKETPSGAYKLVVRAPTDKCVRMEQPTRWKGLWRAAFEGSQFCPEPATSCGKKVEGDRIWLTRGPRKGGYESELYRIEFVGRKTKYKGSYGHFGMYDQEIIVDRVISKELVWAPPPPSKETLERMKAECRALPRCSAEQLEKAAATAK